jgi:hypothetical protein
MTMLTVKRESLKNYEGEKLANMILLLIIGAGLSDCKATWIAKLSSSQKALYLLSAFDTEVRCGGFHQFFSNSSGNYTQATVYALRLVGAVHIEGLLKQAMAKFPQGFVSEARDEREKVLSELPIDPFRDLDKMYSALLQTEKGAWTYAVRYLEANEEEFFI